MAAARGGGRREEVVAVVGAGAAGLAAARRLIAAGLSPLVLEARGRVGGRAYTVMHEGIALDRGCAWLHSADRNPWSTIAADLGLTVVKTPSPWRKQFGDLNFPQEHQAAFAAASDALDARLAAAAQRSEEAPAARYLEPGGRWNPLIDAVSTYYNGTELDRVSIQDYDRYADDGRNWRVREGYGRAVATFGADVPVRLHCPVSRIDHAGPRLRLDTPEGTIEADQVIVTVPPTMIVAGHLRLAPELPEKTAAAHGLPLGMANKMVFAVTRPDAFPQEAHAFGRTDRAATASYHFQPFGAPIVEGYFGGACASALEQEGEAAFAAYALDELVGLFGTGIRTALRPLFSTAWKTDRWALGAYSHALPGHADDRARWAAPVDGRLFFAGEACSKHDFSTAHGAYLTGRAAAEAVLAAAGDHSP